MKAIIPVAGAGTRLRPHTYTQPKPLIPVAGKTIISFIIDQLAGVGIKDYVFVIGYLGEKIQNYLEKKYPELNKEFVVQGSREGIAHAIWTARDSFSDSEEVVIVFGDTIIDLDLNKVMSVPNSCFCVKQVKDPREFGVVEFDKEGIVKKVVEKPNIPKSNMAMVGFYKIKEVPILIDVIDQNIKNNVRTHGEFQLTDALMGMIERGVKFTTVPVDNWFDCGKKEILLETNAMLLDKEGYASDDLDLPAFENTIIVHPVSIGKDCEIANSIIGPHVTIGNHVKIEYSIIKKSIIGNYAAIEEVVLHNSLVGSDAAIKGLSQSLNIGDNTEIDFS
ncbi:MAG: glucose-1-phosphate thymidylyltransferase [Saprospiraceae bacterium]|jgi:glucose-1-phosphate thymidylyltransferase